MPPMAEPTSEDRCASATEVAAGASTGSGSSAAAGAPGGAETASCTGGWTVAECPMLVMS